MGWFIGGFILLVIMVVSLVTKKEHLEDVHEDVSQALEEKKEWHEQKHQTYGEVMQRKEDLIAEVHESIQDEEKRQHLDTIINEWAEMKITSFHNKRSWLRQPKTDDE